MPDETETDSEIQVLKNLIEEARIPQRIGGGNPFTIIPKDHGALDVEPFLETPSRKRGSPVFTKAESFCAYVNEQKSDASRLYVPDSITLVAILDHHGATAPGWAQHRATLRLIQTPEWQLWKSQSLVKKSQRDFAQFIEDNSDDVASPSGAELLDVIRTIKASQSLECTGEISESGDVRTQGFVLAAKNKVGAKQDIELPSEFGLVLKVYEGEGGDPIRVRARLRLEVCVTRLVLSYELVKVQKIEQEALEAIVTDVAEETEMEAWFGAP